MRTPPHGHATIRNVMCEYYDGKGQMQNSHVGPCASCGKEIWIENMPPPNVRHLCKTCFKAGK